MNPRAQDNYTQAYNAWVRDQSAENMAALVSAFTPTINSELQQYAGPKNLLRSRAKSYVIGAVRSYDPLGKTSLNSWVVTNLRQLSRYGKRLRPIRASEDAIRGAAELSRVSREMEDRLGRRPTDDELQDETGWTARTIERIRSAAIAFTNDASVREDVENGPEEPSVSKMDDTSFYSEAVYNSLNDLDKRIYDAKTGAHGKAVSSGKDLAADLGVTPSYVSQRAASIASDISRLGSKG